jgi:hypothetical protein
MFRDLIAKLAKKADSDLMLAMESKPLDPGASRDPVTFVVPKLSLIAENMKLLRQHYRIPQTPLAPEGASRLCCALST